jgi:hypothetical protein
MQSCVAHAGVMHERVVLIWTAASQGSYERSRDRIRGREQKKETATFQNITTVGEPYKEEQLESACCGGNMALISAASDVSRNTVSPHEDWRPLRTLLNL